MRAAMSPYHLTKAGVPKPALFRSPPDCDEVSASRSRFVPPCLAKLDAKVHVERDDKVYRGLAFLLVADARALGFEVVDSRGEYLGHCDLKCGMVQKKHEPLPPDVKQALDDRYRLLLSKVRYMPDSHPDLPLWLHGEPRRPPESD